jgi:hypothetical protein
MGEASRKAKEFAQKISSLNIVVSQSYGSVEVAPELIGNNSAIETLEMLELSGEYPKVYRDPLGAICVVCGNASNSHKIREIKIREMHGMGEELYRKRLVESMRMVREAARNVNIVHTLSTLRTEAQNSLEMFGAEELVLIHMPKM